MTQNRFSRDEKGFILFFPSMRCRVVARVSSDKFAVNIIIAIAGAGVIIRELNQALATRA